MSDNTTPENENAANFGSPVPPPPPQGGAPTPPPPPTPPTTPTPSTTPTPPTTPTVENTYPTMPEFASNVTAASTKKRGSKKLVFILIAIFGVAALSGIAVFAFNAFSSSTGGADTPEGVITNFTNAVKDKDLPAMLSAEDPNEIEPFIENLDTFTKEAKNNGTIKNTKSPLEAYSIDFKDIKTETVKYSDRVARVELVSGLIKIDVDKSKLPDESNAKSQTINLEQSNKDYIEGMESLSDDFQASDLESKHIFYIAVKRGDLWYASGLYTSAEYARIYFNALGEEIERPTFDEKDRVGVGSSDSNGAVKNFLGAIVGLKTEGIIESTAPDRFSIGHDYKKTLVELQKDNEDNEYLKIAEDAVTITDLKTTSKANGKDREFNKIESVDIKLKYNIDVEEGEESNFLSFPYSVNLKGSWDGKCYAYSGEIKNYNEIDPYEDSTYDFTDEAPYTDAAGTIFDDAYSMENAMYPITAANGHIYPDEDSTYFFAYHPVPWTDSKGNVVYDALGNKVAGTYGEFEADEEDNYPWKDGLAAEVYDEDGYESYGETIYEKNSDNVDEKNCYSNKDLKGLPDFGLVTIKENGKYYVSPIDTMWYYIIWGVQNN